MRPNGIGIFLVIAVGVSVLAAWLYLFYPAMARGIVADSRGSLTWIVLIVLAIVGLVSCTLAAQLLQNLMVLFRSLVQLVAVAALIIGGVFLWRRGTPDASVGSRQSPSVTSENENVSVPEVRPVRKVRPQPKPEGRWWKQQK